MDTIRSYFPLLKRKINGKPLIYFDNAATSQKPQEVLDSMARFYRESNSNVHRSVNILGEEATEKFENARTLVRDFIGATSSQEIIFTKNATEGINLVAKTWGMENLKKGDIVVLPISEHHSNIVPWLQLKEEKGIQLEYIPLNKNNFTLDISAAKKLLAKPRVKLLTLAHSSNVLGAIHPIAPLIKFAKGKKITVLVDAAQGASHLPIDVKKLSCDFLVFSGHKAFGPTGIGVLWGKKNLLSSMKPFLGGGEMIRNVTKDIFVPNELPYKFEAGTQAIAEVIGLGQAIQFIQKIGFRKIRSIEDALCRYLFQKLDSLDFVKRLGPKNPKESLPIASFTVRGVHPHDVSDLLGQEGIMTRSGHHCAEPLHDYLKIPATVRASLSIFNTKSEIDKLILALKKIHKKFTKS